MSLATRPLRPVLAGGRERGADRLRGAYTALSSNYSCIN